MTGGTPTGGGRRPDAPGEHGAEPRYAVVIPTLGRDALVECLAALAAAEGPPPDRVVVVDDRPPDAAREEALPLAALGPLRVRTTTAAGGAHGPAAARNRGWRTLVDAQSAQSAQSLQNAGNPREPGGPEEPAEPAESAESAEPGEPPEWIVFLDDDVRVRPDWRTRLVADLAAASPDTGGIQGVLTVPLPDGRPATDWERSTGGLEGAHWATADMAYRTRALVDAGGFDERFPRAYREDADLALRVLAAGWELHRGQRRTEHPVRPADPWVSVRTQRGNVDDALMRRLHGPAWHLRAGAPVGRIRRHLVTTALAGATGLLALAGRRRAAAVAGAGWALVTAEFCWARIVPGPRTAREVATMLATSVLIPPLATAHRITGELRWRHAGPLAGGLGATPDPGRSAAGPDAGGPPGRGEPA